MARRLWMLGILIWWTLAAAQPADAPYRETVGGEAFYDLLAERGADVYAAAKVSSSVRGPAAELLQMLHLALPSDGEVPPGRATSPEDVCGFVAGSGGKARIDGGGELTPFWTAEGAFQPGDEFEGTWFRDRRTAYLAGDFPTDVAIIDEFDLDGLGSHLADLGSGGLDRALAGAVLEAGRVTATSREVRHGHLVLHHLLTILGHGGASDVALAVGEGGEPTVLTVHGLAQGPMRVHLFPIEFDGLAGLEEALGAIESFEAPLAVVMSWGITGCRLAQTYNDLALAPETAAGSTFETIVEAVYDVLYAIATAESVDGRDRILADACTAVRVEDLGCDLPEVRAFVATIVALVEFERLAAVTVVDPATEAWGRPEIAFFASAGNERLPFAMPPAAFDGVVAVAACSPRSGLDRAWFSNVGDVIAVGAWFAAPDLEEPARDLGYWGTSFAAPLTALASHLPSGSGDSWRVPDAERLCGPFAR